MGVNINYDSIDSVKNNLYNAINYLHSARSNIENICNNLSYEIKASVYSYSSSITNGIEDLAYEIEAISDFIQETYDSYVAAEKQATNIVNKETAINKNNSTSTKEKHWYDGIESLWNTYVDYSVYTYENTQANLNKAADTGKKVVDTYVDYSVYTYENTQAKLTEISDLGKSAWDTYLDYSDYTHERTLDFLKNPIPYIKESAATVAVTAQSFVKGVANFGESVFDAAAVVGGIAETPILAVADFGQYLGVSAHNAIFNDDMEFNSLVAENWKDTMNFVKTEYVNDLNDKIYNDTAYGKWVQENSAIAMDGTLANVSEGIGHVAGVVLLTIFTAGVGTAVTGATEASVAGTTILPTLASNAGISATIAGLSGLGSGTEDAWNDGANLIEGLLYGSANAGWEALQYYIGSKISGIGNVEVTEGMGTISRLLAQGTGNSAVNSLIRVGLDTVDSGAEGFFQPLLKMIYRDESYSELFEENGGFSAVLTNALIGGGSSILGEIIDLTQKNNINAKTNNVSEEMNDVLLAESSNIDINATANHFNKTQITDEIELTTELLEIKNNLILAYGFDEKDVYDRKILDSILTTIRNDNFTDDNVRDLFRNYDSIKEIDKWLQIGYTRVDNSSYNSALNSLIMRTEHLDAEVEAILPIFNHESGHMFYDIFLDKEFRTEAQISFENARNRVLSNPDLAFSYIKEVNQIYEKSIFETVDWYNPLRAQEKQKIESVVMDINNSGTLDEVKFILDKVLPSDKNINPKYKKILDDYNLNGTDFDAILNNKEALTEILVLQNNIANQNLHQEKLMTSYQEYGDYRKVSSMINSLVRENNISDVNGNQIGFQFLHDKDAYWKVKGFDTSYNELIADYISLASNGRTEALEKVENVFGTELMDQIRFDVSRMREKLVSMGLKKR